MSAFWVEVIGVLGFATNVWANILLARKAETGWAVRLGANVLWLWFGIAALSFANILSSVVFAGINVYGWCRWRRERLALPPSCVACVARALVIIDPIECRNGERCVMHSSARHEQDTDQPKRAEPRCDLP